VNGEGEAGGAVPPLLLDQNVAPGLARRLADLYPGSAHVRDFGLQASDDEAIWAHAAAHGFVIVTKDDDFRQRSLLRGAPPRVIWLRLGNCRTADVEAVLRARVADVLAFARDPDAALLILARRQ
jgi:predicted nuclease of predicted toxin-antitoxin system